MKNLKNNEDTIFVNNIKEEDFTTETLPHENALYNYALKISGNSDDAQDLVQETYYKAYRHFDKFQSGTNSKAWMFMILKNTFINNLDKEFYNDLFDDELTEAIDQLPTKMREVFLLCDLEGYSYEETAELVDCPIGTVRSRLHRARHMLQEILFDYAKEKGFLN